MLLTSFVLGVSLAIDAFVASIAIGTKEQRRLTTAYTYGIPLTFGLFQAAMPLIGWLLASSLLVYIGAVDHWIAFVLLGGIGINMLRNSRRDEDDNPETTLSVHLVFTLAVATSIDALAVGFTLPAVTPQPLVTIAVIGIVTSILCYIAIAATRYIPKHIANPAELVGGLVLIALAFKILFSHLLS